MPPKKVQESLDRLVEQLLPIKMANAAVGLEDHRRMLAANAQRVRESHVAMAKAAGFELPAAGGEDAVGDIIITGDIMHTPVLPPQPTPPNQVTSKLLQYGLLAASFAAGGIGGPLIASMLLGQRPAAVQPAAAPPPVQEWEIKVWSVDGSKQQSIKPVEPTK